jgi:5-methylthioadenosine/S-adenosylhomocysteine deaminase
MCGGEITYRSGHFISVDRDSALKALHNDLQKAQSDDEVARHKLSKALLPNVKEVFLSGTPRAGL